MGDWWLVPAAYLVGSVQWGLLVVRAVSRVDVRDYGSGKTGVTNVLRTAGRGPALLALLGDSGKGSAMAGAALLLSDDATLIATVAGVVIAGHVWPVFSGFHGGRGIATGAAAAATLVPLSGLVGLGVFVPVVAITRYVSLGSMCGVIAVMVTYGLVFALGWYPLPYLLFSLVGGALVLLMHRSNVVRLLQGTERRLGERVA
jgi:glycerol-3-phosphate acyltransferase PlsY